MLWNKDNYTYSKKDNLRDTDFFVNILDKLKTYSKCINASGYSVTNTLEDVYNVLKYQHAFWITLTNASPESITLEGLELKKGFYYNLSKDLSDDIIINSQDLKNYMDSGYIKAANSLLFEEDGADDFFTVYQPIITTYYGTSGTNAPVENTSSSGALIQGTNFIDNTITTVVTWDYGTYGTSFNHILINSSYTLSSWKNHYQESWVEGEWGYSQRNLFTSEKILTKLLKNFTLIDLASTENIDINKIYPILNIDGTLAVSKHKILLKNQVNTIENGVYEYVNQKLILDKSFDTIEDYYLYSVYVKEGISNREKQFFLDREQNGDYPLPNEPKNFIESTNYIVRNRLSYRLLQNHSFSDLVYFTKNEPLTDFDFTENIYGTSGIVYSVNENYKTLDYTNGTNFIQYKNYYDNTQFISKIQNISNDIYLVGKKDINFFLFKDNIETPTIAGTEGTSLVYNYFNIVSSLPSNVVDFKLLNSSTGLFLTNNIVGSTTSAKLHGIILNSTSFMTPITLNGATEFEYLNNGNEYFFFINSTSINLYHSGSTYTIKNVIGNIKKLRVNLDGSTIHISYLVNGKPEEFCINETNLINLLGWQKDKDYELNFFSKEKINDWEIKDPITTVTTITSGFEGGDYNLFTYGDYSAMIDNTHVNNINNPNSTKAIKLGSDEYGPGIRRHVKSGDIIKSTIWASSNTTSAGLLVNSLGDINGNFHYAGTTGVSGGTEMWFPAQYSSNGFNYQKLTVTITVPTIVYKVDGTPADMSDLYINTYAWNPPGVPTTWYDDMEVTISRNSTNLYLKDVRITNLPDGSSGTSFNYLVPKISNGDYRTYDGINDYSDMSKAPMTAIKNGNGSFTIEFKIKPNGIRNQMPVFYFGEKSKTFIYSFFGFSFSFQLPVLSYMTFVLKDGDGFPYFLMSENSSSLIKLKANRVIKENIPLSVAFTWQYTANKATGRLYFKEDNETTPVLVGTVVDQKSIIKAAPLSIKNLILDTCLIGKSNFKFPNFKGNISQFRIWDRELNPSQLNSRMGKVVNSTDVIYSNLKGYWKLDDKTSHHLETISNTTTNNIFFGGLNRDAILPTIQSVSQIQQSSNNLFILENDSASGTNGIKDVIYRIDLNDEKIYKIYTTSNNIKSIYLENNDLYFLENNKVYKFNTTYTSTSLFHNGTGIIEDFAIVNSLPYLYKNDDNIYNNGSNSTASLFNNNIAQIKTIYGKSQGTISDVSNYLLNIYILDTNGNTHLLSDEYLNTTSGLQTLDYIGTYPLKSNNNLVNGTNSFVVDGLTIYRDNVNLDLNGELWSKNLKTIHGIYNRQDNVLILISTIYDEIQLWQYDNTTHISRRFIDSKGNATMIKLKSIVDLTYHTVNNEEFITLLNPLSKSITWFKLQRDNKFSWTCLPWTKKWIGNKTPIAIDSFTGSTANTKISILSQSGSKLYLSSMKNTSANYNLWEDCLTYDQDTDGLIIGSSGILFKDNSSTSWSIELQNLLYKNDFLDIEIYIEDSPRDKGYLVPSWSGIIWLAGKNGILIKSIDNGITWTVLESGVSHDLNSISFFGNKNGLLAGDNGTILATFTGGESFESIVLPEEIKNRDWKKVLMYSSNNAILLGNGGTLVHLTRKDFVWSVDKILNKLELNSIDKQILDSDLNNSIHLNIKTLMDADQYQQTLNDVQYLGDNKFLICGERDLLLHLELVTNVNYKEPILNFFKTNTSTDWKKIKSYIDFETNEKRAFILNDKKIYSFEYDRIVSNVDSNIHDIEIDLFFTNDTTLNKIDINNNYLFTVGDRVNAIRKSLFKVNNGTSGYGDLLYYVSDNSSFEEQDLKKVFQPKLLFLDYYLGRKINLHLEEGGFEVPKTSFSKNLLSCYYFLPNDYIEFTDYGTVNNQNNFLAFQDYFYLNRRVLDGGLDKFGKMESWIKYNKRITAASTSGYINNCLWCGEFNDELFTQSTSGTNFLTNTINGTNFFRIVNDLVNSTSGETYINGSYNGSALNERSYSTKIQIDSMSFAATQGDVIKLTLTKSDKTILIENGYDIVLNIKTPYTQFNMDTHVKINENGVLKIGYLNLNINSLSIRNITTLEDYIQNFVLLKVNTYETANLLSTSTLNDIVVEFGILILSDNFIIRDYNTINQTITLWTLFDQDIIEDARYGSKLFLKNLNYFNGNLLHLEEVFSEHLIAQSYTLDVNKPDSIYVEGFVNDLTKYYNLESYLKVGINGSETIYPISYGEDVVYGPKYDLISFLNDINPVFDESYTFNLPSHNFTYSSLLRNNLNEFKEFTIVGNKIYIGNDLINALDFVPGTFVDITRGSKSVNRAYLSKIEIISYSKYADKKRYVLHFNYELENKLQDLSTTVSIRTRNTLREISQDLEFTDDLMFPLPNGGTNGVELFNNSYFNQTKTATAYAPYILNDVNIRNNISAVVYLDNDSDWNINIIDWKTDPNLYYRPVDLHELGIDKIFKKAISVEPKNLGVDSNKLILKNIDIEKYNYRLVDGLTLEQLEKKYYWILNADMRNAIIGENDKGLVWYQGDWLCGIWEEGTWYSGRAFNIEWIKGDFYSYKIINNFNLIEVIPGNDSSNSIWYKGLFGSGNFYNGTWYNGTFNKGNRYAGLWYNGQFLDGVWYSGTFMGGEFFGGTWLSGTFSELMFPSVWHYGTWLGGDFENGVWKNGIWDQTVRVKSRFGTKASLLHKAVWEYGWWKGGEFHSGLNVDKDGKTIASINYANSTWCNGVWDKGEFYGGIWKMGTFNNGIWYNGYWLSDMEIDSFNLVYLGTIEIKFKKPHFFKTVSGLKNHFTIIGIPIITDIVHLKAEDLGYNTKPVKHEVIDIIDEYTISIATELVPTVTPPTPSPLPSCYDYTLVAEIPSIKESVALTNLGYIEGPYVVSHWSNGTWLGGIFDMGLFSNGLWKGGIFLNGVVDNGIYGE